MFGSSRWQRTRKMVPSLAAGTPKLPSVSGAWAPPTLGAAATAPAAQPTAFPDCSLPVHPLMLRRRRWRLGVDCRVLAAQGLEMLQNEYNALLFLEIPLTRKCAKRSTHGKNPLAHLCGDNC